ncbi:sulfur carrier protein ThiS [Vibrio sp. MACH09]|uniref:sulfur carrier protein ThiS n=1 Tax=unclassified Vibrio TaxID=2614977 RepID=UPI001C0FACE9|nr:MULTISPECIES: sulfur carrier protein ThiS [unclassified Vibrio]GLO63364.1 sulfur carrier protein ThiS [Vibrio sp. MACH09]
MSTIEIKVNDKPMSIAENTSIEALLALLQMPNGASAVAVNQAIISRQLWNETVVNEGDHIALFQAIAGG